MPDKEIEDAYRDWAWLRDGVPIGYMPPAEAARIGFRAGVEWARKQNDRLGEGATSEEKR